MFSAGYEMSSSVSHSNNFDLIRILAALAVLVSHQFALVGQSEPSVLGVYSLGGFGVLVFFSLSGYLVAQSWSADPNIFRFALRRLLRIWPGLAVAVVLSAFVLGPLVTFLSLREYFEHPQLREYMYNLAFNLRGALPLKFDGNALPYAVNGSLWTIPLEIKCYAVLGVLGVAGLLRNKWWLIGLALPIALGWFVVDPRGEQFSSKLGLSVEQRFFVEFGLFFAAGSILHWVKLDGKRGLWAVLLFWGAGVLSALTNNLVLALWLILPVTAVAIGVRSLPFFSQIGRFGDFSYGLYIYAFPVQQVVIWTLGETLSWSTGLALSIAITCVFAFASWHLVEKRALRLKPKRPSSFHVGVLKEQ